MPAKYVSYETCGHNELCPYKGDGSQFCYNLLNFIFENSHGKSAGTDQERQCDIGDVGTGSNVTPQWFGLQCVTACCDIVTIHLAIYNN